MVTRRRKRATGGKDWLGLAEIGNGEGSIVRTIELKRSFERHLCVGHKRLAVRVLLLRVRK
jgi:hypothetical protein